MDLFNLLRETTWKNLLEGIAFFGLLLGLPTGGAGLVIVFPIGTLLMVLKFGLETYDKAQANVGRNKNWSVLENHIISLAGKKYFGILKSLVKEMNQSEQPNRIDSSQKWLYLNKNVEIALEIYTIIAGLHENDISPDKRKIKTLSIIGLNKIENSFQYVFQVFERMIDQRVKSQLAETLAKIAGTAQTHSLFVFIEYVLKDYTYLRTDLMKSIMHKAHNFNQDEIKKILKLADFPYQPEHVEFYLQRTQYFFNKAYDRSTKTFRKESQIWLTKIIQDFFGGEHSSHYSLSTKQLNEESGILLAVACRELKEYKKAIIALENVLWLKPNSASAVIQLIYIYELMGDFESVKKVLSETRTQVASNEWFQDKLKEYDLA